MTQDGYRFGAHQCESRGQKQRRDGENADDHRLHGVDLFLEREAQDHRHQHDGEDRGDVDGDVVHGLRRSSQHQQRNLPELDGERIGQAVHGELVLILGIHDQEIDFMRLD